MQRKLSYFLTLASIPIVWTGITSTRVLFEFSAVATTAPTANGQILQVNGNARLERQEQRIQPLPGTPIYPGDRLLAARGSELVVQCSDLTIKSISTEQFNGCAAPPSLSCNPDLYECPPRGELASNDELPYPISPRRTHLLNDRPQLRWNPVAGATEYTVSLFEDGTPLWQVTTADSQMNYPNERRLRSGVEYMLVIETDTGISSLDAEPIPGGFGFRLLSEDRREEVTEEIDRIETQALDKSAQNLAIAFLYVERGLIAEAIDILENPIESGMQNAALYNRLGQLYWDYLALPENALESYCQTVELASSDFLELREQAQERLDRFTHSCQTSP
ncbi:hypothetical protein IQ235_04775 [Oscillatoriales cyanobacterium LEGE 11467]|uniref:Tetratricopeptide repeat protein n=1 Tax=Zarconia navalis LEGE 11467 TaxID=1828826 RepID=A0A928Z8R9_9CYAN|nr:hypothetical protein [Zarconia navalis]MBE9040106.1 hypothetical protein [Zarconia navalis LEGE 11467]